MGCKDSMSCNKQVKRDKERYNLSPMKADAEERSEQNNSKHYTATEDMQESKGKSIVLNSMVLAFHRRFSKTAETMLQITPARCEGAVTFIYQYNYVLLYKRSGSKQTSHTSS